VSHLSAKHLSLSQPASAAETAHLLLTVLTMTVTKMDNDDDDDVDGRC